MQNSAYLRAMSRLATLAVLTTACCVPGLPTPTTATVLADHAAACAAGYGWAKVGPVLASVLREAEVPREVAAMVLARASEAVGLVYG